ncbi:MAG: esterase-like activity of phytase family protein [Verrucomicrobiota bacterium]
MKKNFKKEAFVAFVVATALVAPFARAVDLIAVGSISGTYEDFATETSAPLENGIAGNTLGGLGSGLAYAGGTTFLAIPDRGPNANPYNPLVDDTVSYINRFQTLNLSLAHRVDPLTGLPFTLTPMLLDTTLLSSRTRLNYGTGAGLGYRIDGVTPLGSGAPALNAVRHTNYFTGRSDNFDATKPSTNPNNGRLDPESIRVSNDGKTVFISDEYGPYIYQFDRETGSRIRSFELPTNLAITSLSSQSAQEIANNPVGRVTNKGMEGLAITPDGKMLVGIMQANLEQDKKGSLRIVTVNIQNGATHEYAYQLSAGGSGVSDILAVNNHQFLVDERDGTGLGEKPLLTDTASKALVKKVYLIDIAGAQDITHVAGPNADLSSFAVPKSLFFDFVAKITAAGFSSYMIPSKMEGLAFGQDVVIQGETVHTLFFANDNDFLATNADPLKLPNDQTRGLVANPNMFYVFAFKDSELPGFVPQRIRDDSSEDCHSDFDGGKR